MPTAKSLRKELVSYLKSKGIDCHVPVKRDNIVYIDQYQTGSFYFDMGTFVVFENDGWKSSTVTIATTGNVKVASSNVKPQVLEAIQQQNESSLSQFYLVGNAVMGKLTTQVQPGSVGERCWAGATLLASEAESFLMDIEELLDPASYQTELSEADQQALEDAVLNM